MAKAKTKTKIKKKTETKIKRTKTKTTTKTKSEKTKTKTNIEKVKMVGDPSGLPYFWPRRLVRSSAESTTGEQFEPLRRTEERGDTENQQFPNFQNYARCEKDLKDN